MGWTIKDAVRATGGRLLQGNPEALVGGFSTDTRSIQPGLCFVALMGERHDGHRYAADAVAKGAVALLLQKDRLNSVGKPPGHVAVIEVEDTLWGLGDLARAHRSRFRIPLVGITGSNGKTSTKEMVAAILAQRNLVLKNSGNLNNLIGVPLTLLALQSEHQAAVVEMGINVPGEMSRLVDVARPTVGLITNIHPAHLEGLHSLEQILEEKGKLWRGMGADGLAVINADDEKLREFGREITSRAITYSIRNERADVALKGSVVTDERGSLFDLNLGGEVVSVRLSVLGDHHLSNAVAAAAVAWGLGESAEIIARGLGAHAPVPQRMEMHRLKDGRILVDDTYNANPMSMMAAAQAVCKASRGCPVVFVLADMKELGPDSPALHRDVGRKIGAMGVAGLITLGEMSRELAEGAREAGLAAGSCRHAGSHEEAAEWLLKETLANEWILIKGSRSMAMEKVVERILKEEGRQAAVIDGG